MSARNTLPPGVVEGFMRLCQGDFSFRLPRDFSRDERDTGAFFFNSVADELQRLLEESHKREQRLGQAVDALSAVLTRVAAGDLGAEVERDFKGDELDVLSFLVNNTIAELRQLVEERARKADEQRKELEALVEQRTHELRVSEESFRLLFAAAPEPMMLFRADDAIVHSCNESAATMLRIAPDAIIKRHAASFFESESDRRSMLELMRREGAVTGFAVRFKKGDGEAFWALANARTLDLGGVRMVMATFADLTQQKAVEDQLRELATRDALTRALNRRHFFELAEAEVARAARYGGPLALAMLDLDHFKTINDRFGHGVGDEALQRVAHALSGELRRQDQLGRYGGEEFAMLLPQTRLDEARVVLERCRRAVEDCGLEHEGEPVRVTVSAGAVEWRADDDLGALLRRADEALYEAKATGRNRVVGWTAQLDNHTVGQ